MASLCDQNSESRLFIALGWGRALSHNGAQERRNPGDRIDVGEPRELLGAQELVEYNGR